jgi:hypothetical protein
MDGENPIVPEHLRPLLGAAAELELEHATDGYWSTDGDERAIARVRLLQVTRMAENWDAGTCSREETATLARLAVPECDPGRWPRTLGEADHMVRQAGLTRDLILFRDAVGGMPIQEEIDEPL